MFVSVKIQEIGITTMGIASTAESIGSKVQYPPPVIYHDGLEPISNVAMADETRQKSAVYME